MAITKYTLHIALACLALASLVASVGAQTPPPGKKNGDSKTDSKEKPGAPAPVKVPAVLAQRLSKSSVLSREGGSKATEEAVSNALDWLVRHQGPGGDWGAADFVKQCKTPCKNKKDARDGDGIGSPEFDVGVTGLALLAFVGAGYTHLDAKNPAMAHAVHEAMTSLIRLQETSGEKAGRIGSGGVTWVYDHAIATLALTELLTLSGDEANLKLAVSACVRLCLNAQNPGSGWRYGVKPNENDSSVTGWMILALEAARHAKLDIPQKEIDLAFSGALAWFKRVTTPNGKTGYQAPGDEGSRLAVFRDVYPFEKSRIQSMTAFSSLCRILCGTKRKDPLLASSVKLLSENQPLWQERSGGQLSTINFYYWFQGTHALFQQGGADWKSWNKSMTAALIKTQRTDGDEKGSWDPLDDWGRVGGRVYSTALAALTLEVYYRYPRAREGTKL